MARAAKRIASRNSSTDKRAAILRAATASLPTTAISIPKLPTSRARPTSPTARSISTSKAKKRSCTRFSIGTWQRRSPPARKLIEKVNDPREKLRRIASLHLERLGADRDLAVVFQVELRGSTKFMEEFSAAGFAEYLGIAARHL